MFTKIKNDDCPILCLAKGPMILNGMWRCPDTFDCTLCHLIYLYLPALRCGIQFLGNIAVGNQLCKEDIWAHGYPDLFS